MYCIATFSNPCCSTCWIPFIPADCNVPLLLSHFDSSLKFGFYHLSWAFLLEVYLERGYRELGDCLVRMWPGLPRFQVFIFVGDQRSQCTSDPLLALRRNRKLTYDGFRDFVQPLQKQIVQLFMLELRIRSQNVGRRYLLWFCTFSFCVFDIFPI